MTQEELNEWYRKTRVLSSATLIGALVGLCITVAQLFTLAGFHGTPDSDAVPMTIFVAVCTIILVLMALKLNRDMKDMVKKVDADPNLKFPQP